MANAISWTVILQSPALNRPSLVSTMCPFTTSPNTPIQPPDRHWRRVVQDQRPYAPALADRRDLLPGACDPPVDPPHGEPLHPAPPHVPKTPPRHQARLASGSPLGHRRLKRPYIPNVPAFEGTQKGQPKTPQINLHPAAQDNQQYVEVFAHGRGSTQHHGMREVVSPSHSLPSIPFTRPPTQPPHPMHPPLYVL
jgi:hypothetical protein